MSKLRFLLFANQVDCGWFLFLFVVFLFLFFFVVFLGVFFVVVGWVFFFFVIVVGFKQKVYFILCYLFTYRFILF